MGGLRRFEKYQLEKGEGQTTFRTTLRGSKIVFKLWIVNDLFRDWDIPWLAIATQGLDVYSMARYFCQDISLYGFYPFRQTADGKPIPNHYSERESVGNFKTWTHDFPHEFRLFQRLEREGVVKKLVTGKCNSNRTTRGSRENATLIVQVSHGKMQL